jgi:hypothetical protein
MEERHWLNLLEFFGALVAILWVPRLIATFFRWLAVRRIQRQTNAIRKVNETLERSIRNISDKR